MEEITLEHGFERLQSVMQEYADKFAELYKGKLTEHNHKATGNLINSVETNVTIGDWEYTITLNVEDYYYYLDKGRGAGKKPPVDAILSWIEAKGITPTPDKNGKLPSTESLAYMIAKSIGDKGTLKEYGYGAHGGEYVLNTSNELNQYYLPMLQQALEEDWRDYAKHLLDVIDKMIKI